MIKINGKIINVSSVSGDIVIGDKIVINGKTITNFDDYEEKVINITIEGSVDNLTTGNGDVEVKGDVKRVKTTNGTVVCYDVNGDIKTTNGNINCGNVSGDIDTVNGNVRHK